MSKKLSISALLLIVLYLLAWPIKVTPVAWDAPKNAGYVGDFAQNQQLSQVQRIELTASSGPEDFALSQDGKLYFGLLNGDIQYLDDKGQIHPWVNTGGRPLGIEFDAQGNLLVADAFIGLLSIDPAGKITTLLTEVDGIPLLYADDVDVAANGKVYVSDASIKYHAKDYGTYPASLLDIMEHGAHGRIIEFDPVSGQARTLAKDINFANGVAVSHDNQWVLVNETGTYRVIKLGISDSNLGQVEVLIDNLPGFPDNISKGSNGTYWLGLVSPRSEALDLLSDAPFLRKIVQRLPAFVHPKAQKLGHLVAINDDGKVLHSLQDRLGMFSFTTGAVEKGEELYVSSLKETAFAKTANVNWVPEPTAVASEESM